ncbi:PleD family two-component system response regulator [Pedobacter frigidisoli]|uniref:response regulator n=1 Tax=Pedobacter frigidisoli TaxID=2530455 RepID=UPI00292E7E12|nr:response regulator [Pedobacter frigidisoli]
MGSKILVIEDDASNAEVIKLILENEHFHVEVIHRSRLLYPTLKEFEPDLIVMDIMLGDEDGRSLSFDLKSNDNTKHIPIMLITALLDRQVEAIRNNADLVMFKPFEYDKLAANVKNLLAVS